MPSFKFTQPKELKVAKRDRYTILTGVFFLALTIGSFIIYGFLRDKLPEEIPLFYSRVWGEPRLAPNHLLLILPGGNLLLGIFNLGFSIKFLEEEVLISRILQGVTVILTLVSFLAVINIIMLVI